VRRGAVAFAFVASAFGVAGFMASPPAQADPPQCDNGPIVMANCPSGSLCTAVIDGQCVGFQPPLLPPSPPVRVGLQGDIGLGAG